MIFSSTTVHFVDGQAVSNAPEHRVDLIELTITEGEMLVAVKTKNFYNKRNESTSDIEVINKHLSEDIEATVRKSKELIDSEINNLGVDEKYHPEIRTKPANTTVFGQADLET